jgi:hypothetical protein
VADGGNVEVTWAKLEIPKVPTLLLTGDADLYTPPSVLRMFAAHPTCGNRCHRRDWPLVLLGKPGRIQPHRARVYPQTLTSLRLREARTVYQFSH